MNAQKMTPSSNGCPANERTSISCTAAIIGTKWMPQLVLALSHGVCRFSELQHEAGGVNPRTLSARLDELEAFGIITKAAFAEMPPRIEYTLTPKGQDLVPILRQMIRWGNKYNQPQL